MTGMPNIPNPENPTRTLSKEAAAESDFNRRLNTIFNEINAIIKELQYDVVTLNASASYIMNKERVYRYLIDPDALNRLNETIGEIIRSLLMVDENGVVVRTDNNRELWLMNGYVEPEYERSTGMTVVNLQNQSDVYASAIFDPQQVFFSQPYQRRIGFVSSRVFENMQGFNDYVTKESRRVLSTGIALGDSPRVIAQALQDRIKVSKSRANTIARTEINNAHREANWGETQQAEVDYGVRTMQLHISALSPTTRKTHAARSGNLYTTQDVKDWYQKDSNSINCRCSQSPIVVDNQGNPLNDRVVKEARRIKEMSRFASA